MAIPRVDTSGLHVITRCLTQPNSYIWLTANQRINLLHCISVTLIFHGIYLICCRYLNINRHQHCDSLSNIISGVTSLVTDNL